MKTINKISEAEKSNIKSIAKINKLVKSGKLIKSHTSTIREYISRKSCGYVSAYSGRFGVGFTHASPNWSSTRFSYVTYYVKPTI